MLRFHQITSGPELGPVKLTVLMAALVYLAPEGGDSFLGAGSAVVAGGCLYYGRLLINNFFAFKAAIAAGAHAAVGAWEREVVLGNKACWRRVVS